MRQSKQLWSQAKIDREIRSAHRERLYERYGIARVNKACCLSIHWDLIIRNHAKRYGTANTASLYGLELETVCSLIGEAA